MLKNNGREVINGSWGQCFLDGEEVREVTSLKAEVQVNFQDIPMCGTLEKGKKYIGRTGTGTIVMHKCNSRMAIKISNMLKVGITPMFTIVSKLSDPDVKGAERVVLKNVTFNSLTLVDWTTEQMGSVTQPFSFTDWDYLDMIQP